MKLAVVVCVALFASAATLPASAAKGCSIHPPQDGIKAKVRDMAKISRTEGEKQAHSHPTGSSASALSAELEAVTGCLIGSSDMKISGQSGVGEVNVDAGNGKVLNVHHESAGVGAREAAGESHTQRSSHQSGAPS